MPTTEKKIRETIPFITPPHTHTFIHMHMGINITRK